LFLLFNMNKITKLGVSALCGSLAAISAASAGEMSVSAGAAMTWISLDDADTGNPLGISSNYSSAGSGDLENGWSSNTCIPVAEAGGYSNTSITVTVPDFGALRFDQGLSATGIHVFDDATPTVWEEADGAGLAAGINKISGSSASANIQYTPSMLPDGLSSTITFTPDADGGSTTADKGAGGASGSEGMGWDITLTATDGFTGASGLKIYGGYSQVDQFNNDASISGDREELALGVSYAAGGFTIGAQWSEEDTGRATTNTQYDNLAYSVVFIVFDFLSPSVCW
jgi:hypothetical protein